ncbi:MAG: ATP-dependent zinc metalloprotease FtsH [Paludibacteraceae bacterium]|nr:ATP-dependent zinc metalloprotease FtsH [Paludibacteraceae bacterium]
MSQEINNKPNQQEKKPQKGGYKPKFNFYWIYLAIGIFFIVLSFWNPRGSSREVAYSRLEDGLRNGCVSKISIEISKQRAIAEINPKCAKDITGIEAEGQEVVRVETIVPSIDEFSKLLNELKTDKVFNGEVRYTEGKDYFDMFLFSVLPLLLLIGFFVFMNRKMMGGGGPGGVFNVGKSKAQMFDKNNPQHKITFADVAGLEGAKQEVEEIVHFLKNPKKYTVLGGKIPKGALLVGPPGTGKTLLAKAVAGEADVPFFSMSGSDFVEMFVGVGASRVRDLFQQAKAKAPCIVFIDEIDAIGRARGKNINHNGNDERENTLNQLLTEMDGFGSNSGVIILAATNRAEILDKALLRAGRFDRQIQVELPDVHERKAIFNVHLKPLKLDETVDVEFLARQTPGFSGADIANVCNEAALIAARKEHTAVGRQDFLDAVDRIVGGLEKKSKIITAEEKKNIAYHEAGHATISWHLQYADPLVKVTIVPRGQALGASWYLPEERQLTSEQHILDKICALLGGRAAEEIFFGILDTGALSDLEQATRRAYAMVTYFGMSDKLKNISYYDSTGQSEFGFSKPYSEATAQLIDREVQRIIDEQYERAKQILLQYKDGHNEVAQILIDKEVLFAEDLEKVFGKRQWASRAEEILGEVES